jgi:hypothetical protein
MNDRIEPGGKLPEPHSKNKIKDKKDRCNCIAIETHDLRKIPQAVSQRRVK